MAVPVIPQDEIVVRSRRVWWAYLPALAILGLFLFVVPYGFVELRVIHSGLVEEFEEVPGFELVDSDVNWYPIAAGGSVTLRALEGNGVDQLRAHAAGLGYDNGGFMAAGSWTGRVRDDGYDSDMFQLVDNGDGTITTNVSVFDTDLVMAWPAVLTIGVVSFLTALTAGRSLEAFVLRRRLEPRPDPQEQPVA